MEAWLPGYEHDTREADAGAGLNVLPGGDKAILHTTESPRGSYDGVRSLWRGSQNWGRGLPHFIQDGTRFVQLLPLTVNAYTLANPPGPPDTNRAGHVVQVERCGYAAQPMADDEYDACGRWLADLVLAGVGLNLANHPKFYGAGEGIVLASPSSPIRMGAADYTAFDGFAGHQHVPQNDHWDPGGIDGNRLESTALAYLGGAPPEEDMPLNEDDKTWLANLVQPVVLQTPSGNRFLWNGGLPVPTGDVQIQQITNMSGAPTAYNVNDDFIGQLRTGIGCVAGGPGADAAAIAAAVVDQLGPALAAEVATELAARLAQ